MIDIVNILYVRKNEFFTLRPVECKIEVNAVSQGADTGEPGEPSDKELPHDDSTGQFIEAQGTSVSILLCRQTRSWKNKILYILL